MLSLNMSLNNLTICKSCGQRRLPIILKDSLALTSVCQACGTEHDRDGNLPQTKQQLLDAFSDLLDTRQLSIITSSTVEQLVVWDEAIAKVNGIATQKYQKAYQEGWDAALLEVQVQLNDIPLKDNGK